MTKLEIVIPVLNEEKVLASSVTILHEFLTQHMTNYDWQITIADNGSTDSTREIACGLATRISRTKLYTIDIRGRGLALKKVWLSSAADIMAYMDVDLSTDLLYLKPLIDTVHSNEFQIAIGSRLMRDSLVSGRSLQREINSRGYSILFRTLFRTSFKDAQCGFKAISRQAANEILPLVENDKWFFDTEMLILAEKKGYKIKEIPVRWTDDPDSRVNILSTALEDVKGLCRLLVKS